MDTDEAAIIHKGTVFSNVGPQLTEKELDWWSTRDTELPKKVIKMLNDYFLEIANKRYSGKCYSAMMPEDLEGDAAIHEYLEKLRTCNIPNEYSIFETTSAELAKNLNEILDARSNVSVLFVCRVQYQGTDYVCLLNIDPESQDQYKINREKKTIEYEHVTDLLPSEGGLQKGVIYPNPEDNNLHLKIYQRNVALFFNEYLQARTIYTAKKAASMVLDALKEILNREIALQEVFDIHSKLQVEAEKSSTPRNHLEISEIICAVVETDKDMLSAKLKEQNFGFIDMDKDGISNLKLRLTVDSGYFRGPIEKMLNDVKQKARSGQNKVEITSSLFETKIG